ncbi:hypothetical protein LZ30DRAFT_741049 [Colletotrichum cereale]|nr:hypothetical protein LZ30DRAFT_741049 [Colletotrichum cereale]
MSIPNIFTTTLVGVVTLPAIVLAFLLPLRTSEGRHEPSRQWVKYAKVAFGFYAMFNVLSIVMKSMTIAQIRSNTYERYSSVAMQALNSINIPIAHVAAAAVFLSLFYLARAFTLLRVDETSWRFRIGRKCALGAFIWMCLGSVTVMCLSISIWAVWLTDDGSRPSRDRFQYANMRNLAAFSINMALYVTHIICAIGVMVYIVKARKKVLGNSLHKASNLMLTCGILWLIRNAWLLVYIILSNFAPTFFYAYDYTMGWFLILDVILDSYPMFVVLVLLYVLATSNDMSEPGGQERPTKSMDQAV